MILSICSEYDIEADVKYNAAKSIVKMINLKYVMDTRFATFVLTGVPCQSILK